jgi:O-antigen/teichoic acid export membrane protein
MLAFGLGMTTAAGSVFLATINRVLGPVDVGTLISLVFLLATIGVGVLAGLEQEMTRLVSQSVAAGASVRTAVRRQRRQAAGLAVVTVAMASAASPFIVKHWFSSHWYLFFELLVGLGATWASFLVRGLLAGYQDFKMYSATLVVEGLARIIPCLLLGVTGSGAMWSYGLVFALGPLFAAASGLAAPSLRPAVGSRARSAEQREEVENPGATAKLTQLTLATLVSQLVLNGVLLIIVPRLKGGTLHDAALAAAVGSAMGLSRLALLALFPLQAPLLPKLAAAATRGDMAEVRSKTRFLTVACLGAAALGVVVSLIAGPWVLKTVMHAQAELSLGFLAGMAAGTGFLMTAFVLQSAVVALNHHRMVLIAWVAGLAAMGVVFVLPMAALDSAVWASLVGPFVVTAIMGLDVLVATRKRPIPSPPMPRLDAMVAE